MSATWVPITTIPKTGLSLSYGAEEQHIWEEKLANATALECTFVDPIEADVTLQVEEAGVVVSGSFTSVIQMPCSFCLEKTTITVGHIFYDIIQDTEDTVLEEGNYVRNSKKGLEIDVSEIIFEEFLMDCAVSIECKDTCLGLCPKCGINKNTSTCSCDTEKKDPRLEKLRNLTLEKNK